METPRCDTNMEKAVQMTASSLLKMKKNPTRPQNASLHFPSAERNEVSTQCAISSENILHELRGNQDVLR